MSWPPAGSKPPVPPRPTPVSKPQPPRPSRPASPSETDGETKVKPQAKPTAPTPPQFQHDGIDPLRALLILGLPLLAAAVVLLVLFASPLAWWIAAGVTAAGVLGGVVLRRSRKARGLLRRLPGAGRAASALRRTANGRFSRSPLGRVVNRALGRRPGASSGGGAGGSSSRPKTLSGKLRSLLPSWAGGTRKPSSSNRPGGRGGSSSEGRPGGRMRSLLNRLKPGGGRRPGALGGASQGGSKTKPKSLLGRAAGSVGKATGRASRAVGSKLFRIRPGASASSSGGGGKPGGKGKNRLSGGGSGGGSGSSPSLDLGVVWTGAGKAGRLVGRGVGALFGRLRKRRKPDAEDDAFDPDSTYEIGIDGEVVNGKHTDAELGRIAEQARKDAAKRAKKLAKKRAKQTGQADPEWPNVDVDEVPLPPVQGPQEPGPQDWPSYDVDDYAPKAEQRRPERPERSLPVERDHDPPPSLPVSPPPHREAPRSTSTNTKHGGKPVTAAKITQQASPSGISAANYAHHIKTNPEGRATGWEEAADHARRDAVEFDGKADKKIAAAEEFERTGNQVAAAESREQAAQLREDASTCRTIATGYQDEAGKEASSAG